MKALAIVACLLVLSTASSFPEVPDGHPIMDYAKKIYDVVKDESVKELRDRVDLCFKDYDANGDGFLDHDELTLMWNETIGLVDEELINLIHERLNVLTEDDVCKAELFVFFKRIQLGRPVPYPEE